MKEAPKHVNLIHDENTTATAVKDHDNSIVITGESFGEPGFEGPVINPSFITKKHRFIYGTGSCLPGYYANSVSTIIILIQSLIIKCHHFIPSEFWSKMTSNSMTMPWTFSIKIPSK